MKALLVAAGLLSGLTALAVAPTAGATNECRGLNPCVKVAGPWVVVPTDASAELRAKANQTFSPSAFWFDGNDAVALVHSGVAIDIVGQIGFDPGEEWGSGLTSIGTAATVEAHEIQEHWRVTDELRASTELPARVAFHRAELGALERHAVLGDCAALPHDP